MHGPIDFTALFAASPNAYMLLTPDLELVTANRAYLEGSGRTLEQLVGRKLFDLFPPAYQRESEQLLSDLKRSVREAVETRRPTTLAITGVTMPSGYERSGERFWSVSNTPIFDAQGAVLFILQHVLEITEFADSAVALAAHHDHTRLRNSASVLEQARRVQQTNRALYAERLQMLRLFDEAPGFICFLRGEDHHFELANRAFYSLVGKRDLLGVAIEKALPELAGQGLLELLDHVFRSQQPYRAAGLQLFLNRDGVQAECVYIELVLQPLMDVDGGVHGILLQGNEVTAQLQAELELRRYREHLEKLVAERTQALEQSEAERSLAEQALFQAQKLDALGKLTGGVVHDVNNVLQLIAGNLQLLLRDLDTPRQRARAESALAAVEKGGRIANQLLSFARRQPLDPRVVDLVELLPEMRELLAQAVGSETQLGFAFEVASAPVRLDPFQLETTLINLAINARDAIAQRRRTDSSVEGRVEIALTLEPPVAVDADDGSTAQVCLRFADNGCGMSAAVQQQAFEPFFTTKERAGTGLGLSLVCGFVAQGGGRVELESTEGVGTTMMIRLPLCQPQTVDSNVRTPVRQEGSGQLVLLIEPDESVRLLTDELLHDLGYRVVACGDCDAAWARLQEGLRVDLLMTSHRGPGMLTPWALIDRMRARWPSLPLVLLASQRGAGEDGRYPAGSVPAGTVWLAKPFGSETLAHAMQRALRSQAGVGEVSHALATEPMGSKTTVVTLSSAAATSAAMAPATTASGATTSANGAPGETAPAVPGRGHILLVEDDNSLRRLTAECLAELGYEVTACASCDEALAAADRADFELLFADVNLKGGSGIELAQALLASRPQLRVVLASGEVGLDARIERTIFLPKPYDFKQLQEVLAEPEASDAQS